MYVKEVLSPIAKANASPETLLPSSSFTESLLIFWLPSFVSLRVNICPSAVGVPSFTSMLILLLTIPRVFSSMVTVPVVPSACEYVITGALVTVERPIVYSYVNTYGTPGSTVMFFTIGSLPPISRSVIETPETALTPLLVIV